MAYKWRVAIMLLTVMALLAAQAVLAQDNVTVPDLTGMDVPQAAALLNHSGLLLGAEINEGWTLASGKPQDLISAQSVAAGQSVARGTAVDITILRVPNAVLVYDDNDLTLMNQSQGNFDLTGIRFNSQDGRASFIASQWGGVMGPGDCGQIWSVARREAKNYKECGSIQWLTTNKAEEHFWTGSGGPQFTISQNGVVRAICDVANPGRCEFYLAGGGASGEVTEYIYFAYTLDRLIVFNRSTDKWMPLSTLNIHNQNFSNPEQPLTIGDPQLFAGQNPQIIGDITRLAPGQCVYFTNSSPSPDSTPQPCDMIARLNIDPSLIFWSKDFQMDSVSDGEQRTCPAAIPDKLTVCIMPR